jgi:hypothetical protein
MRKGNKMKRLFLIVGLLVIGCSENPMNSEFVDDCECNLDISSTLPYFDGSYELEFNADLAQTYTRLDATTECGWSQRLMWDSNYEYRINNEWVSLVNPSSMTDEEGSAHVMFAVWESFINYRITVICGYTDDHGHHYVDSLHIQVVDNE